MGQAKSDGAPQPSLPGAGARRLRVAHVCLDGNLPRYGVGLAVLSLCRALARRGHEVALLCRPESAAALVAPPTGVAVVPLRPTRGLGPRSWRWARAVRRAIAPRVDVVHVHSLTRIAWWLRAAHARRGAPLVLTAHASDELGPSASAAGDAPVRRRARHARRVRALLRRAPLVLTPSEHMAARVREAGASRVVPIALGPTDEAPAPRRPHDGFVVAALARLVPVKGLMTLLDAFAAAFPAGEAGGAGARLVLAGDGPQREALRDAARAHGLSARVDLPGYLDEHERRALLASTDVVAVPTLGPYETFGLAAIDGQAAGAAVLVADGGALPERAAGGGAWVLPAGDVAAWARALRRLRDDPVARASLASRGRAAVGAGWQGVAVAHEAAYDLLTPRRPAARRR